MSQYDIYKRKIEKIFNQVAKIAFKGKDNRLEYYNYVDEIIDKGDYDAFSQSLYYFFQIEIENYNDIPGVKEKTWKEIFYQTRTPFLKKLSDFYKSKKIYQSSYDIYSDDPNIVKLELKGPLSFTYSAISGSQSIHFTRQDEKVFVNIYDPTIFSVEFYKAKIINNLPTDIEFFQTIRQGTASTIYQTNLPCSFSSEYVVKTVERNSFEITNYILSIEKNGLLGQIYEREQQVLDTKYLVQNTQYARVFGIINYYLEVKKIGSTFSVIISENNPAISDVQNQVNNYKKAIEYLLS